MKDRQPTEMLDNGAIRYGIYNADGSLLRYEYIKPEDEPTEVGSALNKANLLPDQTANKLWLPAMIDHDVANKEPKEFRWRRTYTDREIIKGPETNLFLTLSSALRFDIAYRTSDAISPISFMNNIVQLVDPEEYSISYDNADQGNVKEWILRGFLQLVDTDRYPDYTRAKPDITYFIPNDANVYRSYNQGFYNVWLTKAQIVTYADAVIETLASTTRNAYPDTGVHGGYEYEYLGEFSVTPKDPQLYDVFNRLSRGLILGDNGFETMHGELYEPNNSFVEYGRYRGTGTDGAGSPCVITSSFPMKRVVIYQVQSIDDGIENERDGSNYSLCLDDLANDYKEGFGFWIDSYSEYSFSKKNAENTELYWYNKNNATDQCNDEDYIYLYKIEGVKE